jgi:hypothetical protein
MMAHVLSLGGGAALLLGHVLIGLKVRWPVADTFKVAVAGAVMAGVGSLVAAKTRPLCSPSWPQAFRWRRASPFRLSRSILSASEE